jgi:hypothetical protein
VIVTGGLTPSGCLSPTYDIKTTVVYILKRISSPTQLCAADHAERDDHDDRDDHADRADHSRLTPDPTLGRPTRARQAPGQPPAAPITSST